MNYQGDKKQEGYGNHHGKRKNSVTEQFKQAAFRFCFYTPDDIKGVLQGYEDAGGRKYEGNQADKLGSETGIGGSGFFNHFFDLTSALGTYKRAYLIIHLMAYRFLVKGN